MTITPRENTRKNNLQLSVMVLTNELLTGKANGEYKMKSFQMIMNKILDKITTLNILLNKPGLGKNNEELPKAISSSSYKNEHILTLKEDHFTMKDIRIDLLEPVCKSLSKLSKSKYMVKINEQDGANYLQKLLNELKSTIGEQPNDWIKQEDRKQN